MSPRPPAARPIDSIAAAFASSAGAGGGSASTGAIDASTLSDDPSRQRAGAPALHDGEIVILNLKPHPMYILLSSLGFALFLAVLGIPLFLLSQQPWSPIGPRWAGAGFLLLALLRLAWQTLDWWARDYILTDRRVIRVAGVVRRYRFEALLRNIQHVDLQRSALERVFGLGTIGFATSGTAWTEAHWVSVDKPLDTLRIVRETIDKYAQGR